MIDILTRYIQHRLISLLHVLILLMRDGGVREKFSKEKMILENPLHRDSQKISQPETSSVGLLLAPGINFVNNFLLRL